MSRNAAPVLERRPEGVERVRVNLRDGSGTTLHVATFEPERWAPRVVAFGAPAPLVRWCREYGVSHALVGGFSSITGDAPLGELRIDGRAREYVPFDPPWSDVRACVQVVEGRVRIGSRLMLGREPAGDVLQAGPLLVLDGRSAVVEDEDREGFSAGAQQFDSDITVSRHPRAALAVAGEQLLAVACDGRTRHDAGMTLGELAEALMSLGATDALNLGGGGSASLVYGGPLRNRPRDQHGVDLLEGRPVRTAIVFEPR
jgi:hypothetical protein